MTGVLGESSLTPSVSRGRSEGSPNTVAASYRRFPLRISEQSVTVYGPDGRRLGRVASVSAARLFIRGWLREERRAV